MQMSFPFYLDTFSDSIYSRRYVMVRNFSLVDRQDSGDPKQSTADMSAFVQNLLQQMQARFQSMSENIVSKIDEMGSRINELEQSINDLRAEMGVEGVSPSPLAPSENPEEVKPEENSSA